MPDCPRAEMYGSLHGDKGWKRRTRYETAKSETGDKRRVLSQKKNCTTM
jgi:hypothetical protein